MSDSKGKAEKIEEKPVEAAEMKAPESSEQKSAVKEVKDASKETEKVKGKEKETDTKKPVVTHKKNRRTVPEGRVIIRANFNNTIVTITDLNGEVLATSSPGMIGYSGARKSTAYAGTRAAEDAVMKAQKYGIREAKVYIKGPGPGRNSAVKGLSAAGLRITLLSDITPLPHNGCRPRKLPRK